MGTYKHLKAKDEWLYDRNGFHFDDPVLHANQVITPYKNGGERVGQMEWCMQNLSGVFVQVGITCWSFYDDEDAVLFRMKWCSV